MVFRCVLLPGGTDCCSYVLDLGTVTICVKQCGGKRRILFKGGDEREAYRMVATDGRRSAPLDNLARVLGNAGASDALHRFSPVRRSWLDCRVATDCSLHSAGHSSSTAVARSGPRRGGQDNPKNTPGLSAKSTQSACARFSVYAIKAIALIDHLRGHKHSTARQSKPRECPTCGRSESIFPAPLLRVWRLTMQHGSFTTQARLEGPDVWQFRWLETLPLLPMRLQPGCITSR
jgi:hypothetical protein